MLERGAGLGNRFWSLFFPKEPKVPNLMFHIHPDKSFRINQGLVSKEKIGEINEALQKASICNSINDLTRHRWFHRDEIKEMVFGRVGRFIDNYIQAEALREGGYQPKAVASDDSGIWVAMAEAEIAPLEVILDLYAKQSRALAIARGACSGEMFPHPEFPLGTSAIEPYLTEFNSTLEETVFNDPKIPVVGGKGQIMRTVGEARQGMIQQGVEQNDEQKVKEGLRQLGIFEPHEIGLTGASGVNEYLTIAAAAVKRKDVRWGLAATGVTSAVALGFYVHKRRQKSKKV